MSSPIITTTQAQTVVLENFDTLDVIMPPGEQSISIPHGLKVKPSCITLLYSDPNNVELAEAIVSVDTYEILIVNNTSNITGSFTIWWSAKFKF